MRDRLRAQGLAPTAENLQIVYNNLAGEGLLSLKDGSNSNGNAEAIPPREAQFRDERGRFQAQQPTRRSSGISSQSSNRATPRVGISESEAYSLPIEELRNRANAQLREKYGDAEPEYRTRQSGVIADRIR